MKRQYQKLFCLGFGLLFLSACSMLSRFSGPSALDTDQFIKGLDLLRNGHKEEALVYFATACEKKVKGACLYMGQDISEDSLDRYPIMQGMTGKSESIITISFQEPNDFIYEVFNETRGDLIPLEHFSSEELSWPGSEEKVLHLKLNNLNPEDTYRLEIYNGDHQLQDVRWFSSLNPSPKTFHYVIASCMYDKFNSVGENMWQGVSTLNPQALFLIGDNAYLDTQLDGKKITLLHMWNRFMDHRNSLGVYSFKKLIPVFGLWDDHDYGLNNGGKNFELKDGAARIFQSFFPFYSLKEAEKGLGVGYRVQLAKQNFYFLDARSFRDTKDSGGTAGTHLGEAQEKWLYTHLKKSKNFSFLIKGDQYFGGYHPFESYESHHPRSFKKFLKKLGQRKMAPVIFVSGDRHLTEIMETKKDEFPYKTFELTSSGIHVKVYPGSYEKTPNPRIVAGKDGAYNFMYVKNELNKGELNLDVTSFGLYNIVHFSRRLKVKK